MQAFSQDKLPWTEYVDTNIILENVDPSTPFIVDIGSNAGNDLESFLDKHPGVPSESFILQDKPEVLKLSRTSEKIQHMGHDFFTPQPLVGMFRPSTTPKYWGLANIRGL
jgi:hypothetical protein